jgi:hypothetical protein
MLPFRHYWRFPRLLNSPISRDRKTRSTRVCLKDLKFYQCKVAVTKQAVTRRSTELSLVLQLVFLASNILPFSREMIVQGALIGLSEERLFRELCLWRPSCHILRHNYARSCSLSLLRLYLGLPLVSNNMTVRNCVRQWKENWNLQNNHCPLNEV